MGVTRDEQHGPRPLRPTRSAAVERGAHQDRPTAPGLDPQLTLSPSGRWRRQEFERAPALGHLDREGGEHAPGGVKGELNDRCLARSPHPGGASSWARDLSIHGHRCTNRDRHMHEKATPRLWEHRARERHTRQQADRWAAQGANLYRERWLEGAGHPGGLGPTGQPHRVHPGPVGHGVEEERQLSRGTGRGQRELHDLGHQRRLALHVVAARCVLPMAPISREEAQEALRRDGHLDRVVSLIAPTRERQGERPPRPREQHRCRPRAVLADHHRRRAVGPPCPDGLWIERELLDQGGCRQGPGATRLHLDDSGLEPTRRRIRTAGPRDQRHHQGQREPATTRGVG